MPALAPVTTAHFPAHFFTELFDTKAPKTQLPKQNPPARCRRYKKATTPTEKRVRKPRATVAATKAKANQAARLQGKAAATQATAYSSSRPCVLASRSITPISSSVVVSPETPPLEASSRKRRRIIFPLRVLGSRSQKRTSAGRAMVPMVTATCSIKEERNCGDGLCPERRVTKQMIASPFI